MESSISQQCKQYMYLVTSQFIVLQKKYIYTNLHSYYNLSDKFLIKSAMEQK